MAPNTKGQGQTIRWIKAHADYQHGKGHKMGITYGGRGRQEHRKLAAAVALLTEHRGTT